MRSISIVNPLVVVLYCHSASWTVLTLFVVKGCTFCRICGIMVSVLYVVFYVVIFAPLGGGIYFKSVLGPIWGLFPNKNIGVWGCLDIRVLWL